MILTQEDYSPETYKEEMRAFKTASKSESMNTAVGSDGGFLVKPERKSASWQESEHPRDGGKFASKPGAGVDKPEAKPEGKPESKPSHAEHFGDGWKLEERGGRPILTGPDGQAHSTYNTSFAPGVADATTAYIADHADDLIGDMESYLEDEDDDGADAAVDDFNERLDEGLTTFRELVESAMEDANDDDKKELAQAVEEYRTYISEKADDLRSGDVDDVESNGKYLREGLKAAADDLKTAVKNIYSQQAERAQEADQAEQDAIGERMDDLEGTDAEDGAEIAAEINAAMEEAGNRYRVAWDEDEEAWLFADAEDLENWPGKVEKKAKPKGKGRWITIGAKEGKDGKTGGSAVYVEDGKITRGHPSLQGRKLSKFGERRRRSEAQQSVHANRDQWEKEAEEAGVDPEHMHQLARDIKDHDREHNKDIAKLIRDAREKGKANGVNLGQNNEAFETGDHTQIEGFDLLARDLAGDYPHILGAHGYDTDADYDADATDASEKLFSLLQQGLPENMSDDDAYREAINHLRQRGTVGAGVSDDPLPD